MTIPLFVFGTLLDPATRSRVLGRPARSGDMRPAHLPGFKRVFAGGRRYPVLVRCRGARVDGLLLMRLTARDRLRLHVYEGDEYRLRTIGVAVGTDGEGRRMRAQAFFGRTLRPTGRSWPAVK